MCVCVCSFIARKTQVDLAHLLAARDQELRTLSAEVIAVFFFSFQRSIAGESLLKYITIMYVADESATI